MAFFDVFIAVVGIICDLVIIFCIGCKLIPNTRKNRKVKEAYDFIIGCESDVEEEYETE